MGRLLGSDLFLQRGVGEPFARDRDRVALLRDIAALLEEAARRVAGIDLELGDAAAAVEKQSPAVVYNKELLAKHGFYYDLYMSQFRRDVDFSEAVPAAMSS